MRTSLTKREQEKLREEILSILTRIQTDFPERYYLLGEMQDAFHYDTRAIQAAEYEDYLNAVKIQLASCTDTAPRL